MKLMILTITMLLSILAGSLSVTIVSWATSQPLTARGQIGGSSVCGSRLMWVDDSTGDSWPATTASVDQLSESSSQSASVRSNPTFGCAATSKMPADSSAFAELPAGQ